MKIKGMKKIKLNEYVSMYQKPVLGNVKPNIRYMALVIDKSTLNKKVKFGFAREITKSQGNPDIPGFIDESKLIIVKSDNLLKWEKFSDLKINQIEEITKSIQGNDKYLIGLEDPDIFIEKGIKHLYFTIAYKLKNRIGYKVYLGHAQGKKRENLIATKPVLGPLNGVDGFKESCFPNNGSYILNEILLFNKNEDYSAASLSKANNIGKPWKYKKIILNPKEQKYIWIKGHISPCRFIGLLNGLEMGILNGREKSKVIDGKKVYGKFRPGLFLFNSKTGEIPWVDKEPLFEDPDATTITFASDFVKTEEDRGILYCHVNDSFVRAYELDLGRIKERIKERFT